MNSKDTYKAFYEMVKKWTVYDYFTPGIKLEVVLDMLLSEYICDIVSAAIRAKNPGKSCKLHLLAKEFPIDNDDETYRNDKLDYLLGDKETLYLVELKSADRSISIDQKENYLSYKNVECAGEELWNTFKVIYQHKSKGWTEKLEDKWRSYIQEYGYNSADDCKKIALSCLQDPPVKGSEYKHRMTFAQLVDGILEINAIGDRDFFTFVEEYFKGIKKVKVGYITPGVFNYDHALEDIDYDIRFAKNTGANPFVITKEIREGDKCFEETIRIMQEIYTRG